MKIFKFYLLVQRKLLLSPPRPTAATFRPSFRRLSPPELHSPPSSIPAPLALFTVRADIQMPSGLYPSASAPLCIIAGGRSEGSSISFFLLSQCRVEGNCLLSFEMAAPSSLSLPHLVINFAESAFAPPPPSPPFDNQVPQRVPLLASSFEDASQTP